MSRGCHDGDSKSGGSKIPFEPFRTTATFDVVARVYEYSHPATLDEALKHLARPRAVLTGGGTKVNADQYAEPVAVVDLRPNLQPMLASFPRPDQTSITGGSV